MANSRQAFLDRLAHLGVIAAIKEPKHFETALGLKDQLSGVFLMTGNIGVIKRYTDLFHEHDLPVFLHLEKIGGLCTDAYGLDYLAKTVRPTGVVTTKTSVVKTAQKLGLITIQRFFLVDTEGLDNIAKSIESVRPDIIEVMPARIPEMIGRVKEMTNIPIITGGLLYEWEHAEACFRQGTTAVSSSKPELWRRPAHMPSK